ncbi:MAG: hypothetical protein CL946_09600 [Ectothiorhodospiraceae bacterium]|nr:hypothetical protein [Ectothiorhodospiraceae bacterium]
MMTVFDCWLNTIASRLVLVVAGIFLQQGIAASQPRILYFGDSISEGWIDAELRPKEAFPALTDSILISTGIQFRSENLGVGGETTLDGLRRIDEQVLSEDPDLVVIAFGSNDYYILGEGQNPRVPLDDFTRHLELMIDKCAGIGINVIVLGIPPLIAERFYIYTPAERFAPFGGVAALHQSYRDAMRNLCREKNVPFVAADFAGMEESLLGFDGVHPLPGGHRAIADSLAAAITATLDAAPSEIPVPPDVHVYPSPFAPSSQEYLVIRVEVKSRSRIRAAIHDSRGRRVRSLDYPVSDSGLHFVLWDGTDDLGVPVASGTYFLQLDVDGAVTSRSIPVVH